MISLIKGFNVELYNPFVFVHANTDTNSMKYVEKADVLIFGIDDEQLPFAYSTRIIPRSREVGQSYISSVFSTIKAFLSCMRIVLKEKPSLLLVNGPG